MKAGPGDCSCSTFHLFKQLLWLAAARPVSLASVSSFIDYTLTQTFVQTFYRLLAHPEYIEPLRKEVETVVAEEGWTKAGMDKMYKIDSFVRETQRIDSPMLCASNPFPLP